MILTREETCAKLEERARANYYMDMDIISALGYLNQQSHDERQLFDTLQRVYKCPSELLDRNDALDAIMTAYAQYLKAKAESEDEQNGDT